MPDGKLLLNFLVGKVGPNIIKNAASESLNGILRNVGVVDTFVYRKKLNKKRWLLFICILVSFVSGLFGMILDSIPMVLIVHRSISIALVFFLAIHIFVFHKTLK